MSKLVNNKLKLKLSRTVEYLKGLPKVHAPLKVLVLSQSGVGDGPRTKFRFILDLTTYSATLISCDVSLFFKLLGMLNIEC